MIKKSNKVAKENEAIEFITVETCGVVAIDGNMELRLRYGHWNKGKGEDKYDLRWFRTTEDGEERSGKGIALTGEQLLALRDMVDKIESEE